MRASQRAAAVSARGRELAEQVLDRVPVARTAVAAIIRVEVLDRSLIIAAQALFALTPLLVVLAAFTPHTTGTTVLDQISCRPPGSPSPTTCPPRRSPRRRRSRCDRTPG
ncbi:hypothetical protein [Aeromicrobium sp. UC242_57]|uniref:hypothetical protein n=1 Tax=Aeromicrobium sp. UC242_57 TaxID=3374624 RepID=UPI003795BA0F